MTLLNPRISGETLYECIGESCPDEDCEGQLEYWQEQIFVSTFQVKGCPKCTKFWAQGDDGDWLDSEDYWQYVAEIKLGN